MKTEVEPSNATVERKVLAIGVRQIQKTLRRHEESRYLKVSLTPDKFPGWSDVLQGSNMARERTVPEKKSASVGLATK